MESDDTKSEINSTQEPQIKPEAIKSIQGNDAPQGDWIDHGIVDVPVSELPLPEGVNNQADFDHHISWEDAKSATEQLPQIQQEVKAGKNRDDFWANDQKSGLDYANGTERIYDLYYGSDPITIDKIGDNPTIVSGRHRIFAAKECGLETLPVRLREKKGV